MSTGKIKILTVGGGWVANTRHIPALKQSGKFDVIGVVSKHPDRAESTAKRHDIPSFATALTYDEAWQREAEAVMIGSTPHTHYELAKASLLAGKHVLTEKPMTIDIAHAAELRELAEKENKVLAVVHNFQYSRAAQRLRKDFASGRLGKIRTVYGVQMCNHGRNIHDWCDDLPLGLFYDESPHFYYLLRWLGGGELELLNASVWKSLSGMNTPEAVSGEYRSEKGIPMYLHINFGASLTEWYVTVVGEKGTVMLDVWRDIYTYLPNDGVHTAKDITRTSVYSTLQHWTGVVTGGLRYARGKHLYGNDEIVDRFYRAIQGEDSLQGMDPGEGRRVIEMQHELVDKAVYH